MERYLNIIALNIPYPPNYGGVIDIYYKITSLHALGVKIILHCFEYERPRAKELEEFCHEVHYYRRRMGIRYNLSLLPYNVYSRKNGELLRNLLKNDYPILFEGLHSCYYLSDVRLRGRLKIFRAGNIEHDYYRKLAAASCFSIKKIFLLIESLRFRWYQRVVEKADLTLAISHTDAACLQKHFPGRRIECMIAFHAHDRVTVQPGRSEFILYHGKLSVAENERAALYLIRHVCSRLTCRCIIAGMGPSRRILEAARPYPQITVEADPSGERMNQLIREAQVHLLVTFQDTGLKLKLLHSLFSGRHIVVNRLMLAGSGLDPLCRIADTPEELIAACKQLFDQPVTPEMIDRRKTFLLPAYSNAHQAQCLYRMLYEEG